jgi:hypothetical protein
MSASWLLTLGRNSSVCQHGVLSLPEAFLGLVWCSEPASVCQRRALWLPRLMFPIDGIWTRLRDDRRRFASVVLCGFPVVMNLESASRRQALRHSAPFRQRFVLWLPSAQYAACGILSRRRDNRRSFASVESCGFTKFMYAIYGIFFSASRCSVSVCEHRVVWRPDAPLGLIWNWSRRCGGRCRDAQRRFDNVVS